MFGIKKEIGRMTSYERVQRTLSFDVPDRVPIDYSANSVINSRLLKALGLGNTDDLINHLGVDFYPVDAESVGPTPFPQMDGFIVNPEYGYHSRWVKNQFGGYHDFCHFPLKGVDADVISSWPLPDPDQYNYGDVLSRLPSHKDKAIYVGHPGYMDIINSLGRLMGMDECLVNLQLRDEATLEYIRRKTDFEIRKLDRTIEKMSKAGFKASFLMLGEDLGTQISPMISRELFDDVIRPVLFQYLNFANAFSLPVMIHTCGASSWVYEDFISMGVRAVDALQPEAKNMAPDILVSRFGGRLVFHGCISTAAIAQLNPDEVAELCRKTVDIMKPTRGYHFSPSHMIQDNTPIENIISMYQTAHHCGIYS
jgi:hypothetical protein